MARAAMILLVSACLPGPGAPSAPPSRDGAPRRLLLYDWFGSSPCPTPAFIRANRAYLESLPFDGVVVCLRNPDLSDNVSVSTMTNRPVGHDAFARVLEPMRGLPFKSLTRNFAGVLSNRPPDFFNDWSIVIRNFADLAQAVREAGLEGIFFDNTNYFSKWADHPEGVEHPTRSLRDYQEQARFRGRQVMEAMTARFPDVVVISVHGPYVSEPKAPAPLFPQWQDAHDLAGAFFCGMAEGAGKRASCVDGGELFALRTAEEFRDSYAWRKIGIASEKVKCAFLPPGLGRAWPDRIDVAFGVSDRPFQDRDMTPDRLRSTLAHALRQSDRYVWLRVEGPTFLRPEKEGGKTDEWVGAVRGAKAEANPRGGARRR